MDLVGEPCSLWLIGRAHPVGDELFELRNIRPAEPSAGSSPRYSEVYGRTDDVRRLPPSVKQVPTAFFRWLLARPRDKICRQIHYLEDDLETDRFQPLAADDRRGVHVWSVGDLKHHDWLAVITRLRYELPRLC